MLKKNFICLACPNSCRLTVWEENGEVRVEGASCPRGVAHGQSEYRHPVRMLTTTVVIEGALQRRLPVVSSRELPKEKLADCLKLLYGLRVKAPVRRGDVIVKDIGGTGTDILASRSMAAAGGAAGEGEERG